MTLAIATRLKNSKQVAIYADRKVTGGGHLSYSEKKIFDAHGFTTVFAGEVMLEIWYRYRAFPKYSGKKDNFLSWWNREVAGPLADFCEKESCSGTFMIAYKGDIFVQDGPFMRKHLSDEACIGSGAERAYAILQYLRANEDPAGSLEMPAIFEAVSRCDDQVSAEFDMVVV